MSTRNDYSAEEWKAITAAPAAAGLVLACSETPDPFGVENDAVAIGWAIERSAFADAPELVKVLADEVRQHGGRAVLPAITAGDCATAEELLIATVSQAVSAVEATSHDELEPFKAWLASVAAKVLHAAKAARVPAGEAEPITPDEQNTINRLADVLGAGAPGHVRSGAAISTTARTVVTPPVNFRRARAMRHWNERRTVLHGATKVR